MVWMLAIFFLCWGDHFHVTSVSQLACSYGFEEIVHLLLNAGADPQCRHADTGNVALHEAAANGHVQCVKVILHAQSILTHVGLCWA